MASKIQVTHRALVKAKNHHIAHRDKIQVPIIYLMEMAQAVFGADALIFSKMIGRRPKRFVGVNMFLLKDDELAHFPTAIRITVTEIPGHETEAPLSKGEINDLISEMKTRFRPE
jgi:hypothetical protein